MPGITALINEFGVHKHTARCGGSDEKCCWGFPLGPCDTHEDVRGKWHTKRGPNDRWLIPTNHYIMWILKCHFWWEVCVGRVGIGYMLGYPFKGNTSIVAKLNEAHAAQAAGGHTKFDEVKFLQHYRSVAATEGTVRLLGLETVRQYPAASEIRVRARATLCDSRSPVAKCRNVLCSAAHLIVDIQSHGLLTEGVHVSHRRQRRTDCSHSCR